MALAESFVSASLGTQFHWVEFRSKKDKCSFADVVCASPPLSGANHVLVGTPKQCSAQISFFGRLNSEDLCRNFISSDQFIRGAKNKATHKSRKNLDLNLNLSLNSGNNASLRGPPPPPHFQPLNLGHLPYSRCLSHKHSRPRCQNRVRCSPCFRLGYISLHCRFPSRFLGLPLSGSLPSFSRVMNGSPSHALFCSLRSPTGGPCGSGPPCFPSFDQFAQVLLGKSAGDWHLPSQLTETVPLITPSIATTRSYHRRICSQQPPPLHPPSLHRLPQAHARHSSLLRK